MIRKNILFFTLFLAFTINVFAQEIEEVTVTNLSSINSPKMDFGAVPYNNGLMFTSTNGENFKGRIDKCNTGDYFAKLFYAPMDNQAGQPDGAKPMNEMTDGDVDLAALCGFGAPQLVGGDVVGRYHDGTPTFSPNGTQMIFSRNYPGQANFMNACNDGRNNLRLMSADKVEGQWVNLQELPLSNKDYNTAHPTLTADGQCLYFSSDRPGGMGGMDLYKVCRTGTDWGTPMNLGAPVNTAGNELFPTITADGKLYYSSNGLGGQGGLDIHSTIMEDGAWTTPENLGAPFNSPGDDLGFTILADGESGYLTSNRAGGQGGDDIYCWKINKAPVSLAVEDALTRDRIGNALVTIKELKQTRDYTTNTDGMASPDITYRRCYELAVNEAGYEPWSKEVCARELASVAPYVIPLVKKRFSLCGNVIYDDKSIVPNPTVTLKNKLTGETITVPADADGKFCTEITCLDDYEVMAAKDDKTASTDVLASTVSCDGSDNTVTVILPKPVPVRTRPVCNCTNNPNLSFSLPVSETKIQILNRLGSRPEFGRSHGITTAEFYDRLKDRHTKSKRDAKFLDEVFQSMGYQGFMDPSVSQYIFTETTLTPGVRGNMGYTKRHRIKYVQLNTSGEDLEAFRISALNGCDVHFMKSCGNFFFFCTN